MISHKALGLEISLYFTFFGWVTACTSEIRDCFIIQLIIWNLKLFRSTWNIDISWREEHSKKPGQILWRLCSDDKGGFYMPGINVCGNSFQIFSKLLKGELNENSVVELFLLLVALFLATALHLFLSDKTVHCKPNHMFSGINIFNAKVSSGPKW